MDKSDLITLVIAVIAVIPALASLKASSRAAAGVNQTAIITSKTDAETEAYVRARAMDTETINRQGAELREMRAELIELRSKCDVLEDKYDRAMDDNHRLRERIIELERHEAEREG